MTVTFPPVSIRPTTDEERATALASGIDSLKELVAEAEHTLRTLRGLLRLALAAEQDSNALADPASRRKWKAGLGVLAESYSVMGLSGSETQDDLGELATRAEEDLGIVSGHCVFACGGGITTPGNFTVSPRDYVDKAIAEYGLADGEASEKDARAHAVAARKQAAASE